MSPFTIFETILSSYPFTVEKEIMSKHCGMLGTICYYTISTKKIIFEIMITESQHYVCWIRHRSVKVNRTPDYVGVNINHERGPVKSWFCSSTTIENTKNVFKNLLDAGFEHLGYYLYPDEVIEEFTSSTEKRGA